jgi:hypothetical protein
MKNNQMFLILSLFIILGCEKEIDLKIDEDQSKLVLNAWLKTEQHPVLEINRSTFIFDKRGTDRMEDAEVILFEDNEEIGFLEHFGSGFYKNENINIKPNKEYKIIAKADGFDNVTATEKSSEKLKDNDFDFDYETISNPHGSNYQSISDVKLTLKDKASAEDIYLFLVKDTYKSWSNENPEDTTYNEHIIYLESSDTQLEYVYFPNLGQIQILKDELFNGNEYTVRFRTNDLRIYKFNDGERSSVSQNIIEIHKISKSFYLYLKSIEYNQYPDPFTEPTQIYTNVKNGYGILATSAVTKIQVEDTVHNNHNE